MLIDCYSCSHLAACLQRCQRLGAIHARGYACRRRRRRPNRPTLLRAEAKLQTEAQNKEKDTTNEGFTYQRM
jgi:hypothetical protein